MRSSGVRIVAAALLVLAPTFLVATSISGSSRKPSGILALPLAEAENMLSRWLVDSGFEVSRDPEGAGQVMLIGSKGDESWQITIQTRSPLATSVKGTYTLKGKADREKSEKLLTYIAEERKETPVEGKTPRRDIPPGVLSHEESVVCIRAAGESGPLQFSGFVVDEEGLIISTAHDLDNVRKVRVIFGDGRAIEGKVARADFQRDLSLIDINVRVTAKVPVMNDRARIVNGERVYSIGCPDNNLGVINTGIIDGPVIVVNDLPLFQVDINTLLGSSGSPVFDLSGNLVGVVKGRYRGNQFRGFVIPRDTVLEFLEVR